MSTTEDPDSIHGLADAPSPALIVVRERVGRNITKMIDMVRGRVDRLRPHLKTNKMVEVTQMLLAAGIRKFKCATLAEMQMAAEAGATDLLLAYQPVGPDIEMSSHLARRYPSVRFGALVDCQEIVDLLARAFEGAERELDVYLDVDCGMHRTGIAPGSTAEKVVRKICESVSLRFGGLHIYDGHIRDRELREREGTVSKAFAGIDAFVQALEGAGLSVDTVIAGGTPTFPVHAANENVECSPGTCVFWDRGYGLALPDMEFECAALVLTRVVSRPGQDLLCLDLGHKAIAAENPIEKRVWFPALPDAEFVSQSEEHLVVRCADRSKWPVGTALLGIPWHVCPTVALYDRALVTHGGRVTETWGIPARDRYLHLARA